MVKDASGRLWTSQTATPKVLCSFGVFLVCLHTFAVVRTSPMGRQTPTTLLRSLKRNLTMLSKLFNLTQDTVDTRAKYTAKDYSLYQDSSSVSSKAKIDGSVVRAPATNVRQGKLYSKHRFFVQMSKDGFVDGTVNFTSPNVLFEFQSVKTGILRIKHIASGRYLGMDKDGRVSGRLRRSLETLFMETLGDGYHRYASYKYRLRYLGIRKNGALKPGRQTGPKQNAVQFNPIYTQ